MCLDLLRPGGILVTLTTNSRRAGRLVDRAGTAVALARDAGFSYLQHVIVLVAEVREAELAARPSTGELSQIRRAHGRGDPVHLATHLDLCVFAKGRR